MADKLLIPCLYLQSGKAVTGFVRLLKFLLWQLEISIAWKMSKNFFMPAVQRSS